ncbi:hypothetical protein GQX74_006729 [Glossina fuscipes]|nr:hypothetical protein GQX74_006729 [Glossina fuscipes]
MPNRPNSETNPQFKIKLGKRPAELQWDAAKHQEIKCHYVNVLARTSSITREKFGWEETSTNTALFYLLQNISPYGRSASGAIAGFFYFYCFRCKIWMLVLVHRAEQLKGSLYECVIYLLYEVFGVVNLDTIVA